MHPEIASVRRRLAAGTLDAALVLPWAWSTLRRRDNAAAMARRRAAVFALGHTYQVLCHALTGQTVGERIAGIRVVSKADGRPPSWSASLLRNAVRMPPQILRLALLPYEERTRRRTRERIRSMADDARQDDDLIGSISEDADAGVVEVKSVPSGAGRLLAARLPGIVYLLVIDRGTYRRPLHQGLDDRLAGTIVVRASRPTRT